MMDILDPKDIGLIGRKQNGVILKYDKQIVITTDILNNNDNQYEPHITLDDVEHKIDLFAKNILLEGKQHRLSESIVYGESLVELLRWMLTIMKTHKHPPNAPPLPDFFVEADSRSRGLEDTLLNKRVRTS